LIVTGEFDAPVIVVSVGILLGERFLGAITNTRIRLSAVGEAKECAPVAPSQPGLIRAACVAEFAFILTVVSEPMCIASAQLAVEAAAQI